MGFLGYLFIKTKIPVAPALLALILGPLTEANLRRGLQQARGNFFQFINDPITLFFLGISLASLLWCLYREYKNASSNREIPTEGSLK
jgi:putative tricarboxylic transport membrane protein